MLCLFPRRAAAVCTGAAALLFVPITANAQLRVATWNISNYGDTSPTAGRSDALRTAIYGQFQSRSMSPDVVLGQEFQTEAAADNFVNVLNSVPGGVRDWAKGTFVQGDAVTDQEADSAFFYRTSKVNFLASEKIADADSGTTGQPRDTLRFDVSLKGYAGSAPTLSLYSVHLKSSDGDNARRLVETRRIRDDAELLGRPFLVGGDFNVQSSAQSAYQELVGSQSNNAGRFADPINRPGSWNNSASHALVHTQDPSGMGGMDDRHDQIVLGTSLVDGSGFDYIGDPSQPYSSWNDPNHSYRAWGNDGTSFNESLTTTGNQMVGPTIAQALKDVATSGGGHLPIFLDLRTPAELGASTSAIHFGDVQQGSNATASFDVFNGVDADIWTAAGVAALKYAMTAGGDFAVPDGFFTDFAGGSVNGHLVSLDASTMGMKTGTINLFADGVLTGSIALSANVVPEPTGVALIGIAVMGALSRRRLRR